MRTSSLACPVLLAVAACSADGPVEPSDPPDIQWREAPLRIEPGSGAGERPMLVVPDAEVEGIGYGWLVVEGATLRVEGGAVGAREFEGDDDGKLGIVADPAEVSELPPALEGLPGVASLDAREIALDGLRITDYESARIVGDGPVQGVLEVNTHTLLWDEIDGRLLLELDEDADAEAGGGASSRSEVGHTAGIGGTIPRPVRLAGTRPTGAPVGTPCEMTSECDTRLRCIEDSEQPGFACMETCVGSYEEETLRCADDDGCCSDAVCNDEGLCVRIDDGGGDAGDGDGGDPPPPVSDPSQEGGCNEACGDRDGDGVRNGCDQKPDESCSADADNDGCNDSCDANDESSSDGCFGGGGLCRVPHLPRPNSTFYAFILLYFVRGRRRASTRASAGYRA